MTDVAGLAQQAREALATSGGGTLHIHGVGDLDARSADVLLYDDDGQPTFLCEPGSAVTRAATLGRAAVLSVTPRHTCEQLTSVTLAGHLAVEGFERVDDAEVAVIGLRVCTVLVEHDDPRSVTVLQREVPLAEYRASCADPLDRAALRMVRHTNSSHAAELRTFVAGLRGVPDGDIVAAELTGLDLRGVDVTWLDGRGAHRVRVVFPRAADDAASLAARLRDTLVAR